MADPKQDALAGAGAGTPGHVTGHTDDDVRRALNDPLISEADKKQLLAAWAANSLATKYGPASAFRGVGFDDLPPEIKDYIKKHGADDYVKGQLSHPDPSTNNVGAVLDK